MNEMKKGILLVITLCLLSGCKSNKNESLLINDYELSVIESEDCDKNLYTSMDGKDIYLKCIEDVILKKDGKEITLKEYLNNNDFSTFVAELENQVEPQVYKDGGTKIYKKDNITFVLCKKMIDTDNYLEDIYFGNSELTYDNTCVE